MYNTDGSITLFVVMTSCVLSCGKSPLTSKMHFRGMLARDSMDKRDFSTVFSNSFLLFCPSGRCSGVFCCRLLAAANSPPSPSSLAEPLGSCVIFTRQCFIAGLDSAWRALATVFSSRVPPGASWSHGEEQEQLCLCALLIPERHHVARHCSFFLSLKISFCVSFS